MNVIVRLAVVCMNMIISQHAHAQYAIITAGVAVKYGCHACQESQGQHQDHV